MTKMRKLPLIGIVTLVLGYFSVLPCQAQHTLDGDWVGGIDFGKSWQPVNFHFKTEKEGIIGTLDLPQQGRNGLPLNRLVLESSRIHIEWQGRSGLAIYEGEYKDGGIVGTFQQGEVRGKFVLARVVKVDARIYDDYGGSYQLASDRFVDIGPIDYDEVRPWFVDSKTRRTGLLYPSSETTFFSGQMIAIPYPTDIRVEFIRNKRGALTGLNWQESGGRTISAKKVHPHRREVVSYGHANTALKADLLLPATKGQHPALVLIWQGYSLTGNTGYIPYFFLRQGFAVLTLTQRSVGGKAADYQQASFEERARDALAGVELLKRRSDIDPRRIGLWGDSISAWVAPLAATLSPDVSFLILWSPSSLPVTENILYEIESDMREAGFSEGDITQAKAIRKLLQDTILSNAGWDALKAALEESKTEKWFGYARVGWMLSMATPPDGPTLKGLQATLDYDPVPVLERVQIPVLAMNAELDKAINTRVSVPIMEAALRKAGNKDFTIIVIPQAGHNFLESETGYGSEFPRLRRYASGYWDPMVIWLRKHVKVK
jgi:dienelactone hydrolase